MAKYKILEDVQSAKGGKFFKGEVLEGTKDPKMDGFIIFNRKNDFDGKNLLSESFEVEKVDDSTPLTNPADFKGALEESNKADKTLTILSTIGGLAGLYYAYSKKKGMWGYVGFMVLGGIVGSLVANVVTKMKKPKLADATKKENTSTSSTSTPTSTPTSDKKIVSSPNIKIASTTKFDTSKMSKAQKIDLIIKNQSGGEQMDADEVNNSKAFLNTLNDSELNIWISLSKALKDDEINKAMAKSVDSGFKLLQTKYAITRKDAEQQMKRLGDFMTKALESAGFKVTEGQSMFSNFESNLDLDL